MGHCVPGAAFSGCNAFAGRCLPVPVESGRDIIGGLRPVLNSTAL